MLQACACFIELCNLQVINENKLGGKSSLWNLSECDRKGLRKCDLNNFYHFAHNVWAVDWEEWGYRVTASVSLPWKNLLVSWFRFTFCPSSKAIFVKHLWKFSVSSQIFNKVHLRILHSLGILTFFTCINDVSASHRGVGKKPALTTAISTPVGQMIYWMLKKLCLSCVREWNLQESESCGGLAWWEF